MKLRRFLLVPFVTAMMFTPQLFAQHGGVPGSRSYAAKLVTPTTGDVLIPGQQVLVSWVASIPEIDLAWCEVEIYLSLDGGKTNAIRITPQLDPGARSFNWTVPNLPTNQGVLDIHFGCEGYFPESPSIQAQSTFAIRADRGSMREIAINPVSSARVSSGDAVPISWTNSIPNVSSFDLQISYDNGSHFHNLAETTQPAFLWQVPRDFAGHATFRVIAHTIGGGQVESAISAEPQVFVRASAR